MIIVTTSTPVGKRMTTAFVLALALHVALIVGVRFRPLTPERVETPALRVALETRANQLKPLQPAPEAAASNRSGGEASEPPQTAHTATYEPAPLIATETPGEASNSEILDPPPDEDTEQLGESDTLPTPDPETTEAPKRRLSATSMMRQARRIAMASTSVFNPAAGPAEEEAEFDGPNAEFSVREAYIQSWVRKVQAWGNRNFPDQARREGLTGSLTLSVTLRADGSVASMQVTRSSGHDVLDEAARRIVTLAAPYAPFPDSLRTDSGDSLTIRRTWQFLQGSRLRSG